MGIRCLACPPLDTSATLRRFIDWFGHGSEDWADDLTAFDDLRTWVETGVRPAP